MNNDAHCRRCYSRSIIRKETYKTPGKYSRNKDKLLLFKKVTMVTKSNKSCFDLRNYVKLLTNRQRKNKK